MIVGFSGTQEGVTPDQIRWLSNRLEDLGATEFHHGDCIGADASAHRLARSLGLFIVIHPPDIDTKRAFCDGDKTLRPRHYLDRNRDIVKVCDVLLALPSRPEYLRSGTWSTVRYARRVGRPVEFQLP